MWKLFRNLLYQPLLLRMRKAGEFTYQSEMAKSRNANKFKFEVNDTLTYVNYDQFKSADALKYFKTGFSNVSKRDSLNSKMREKRERCFKWPMMLSCAIK